MSSRPRCLVTDEDPRLVAGRVWSETRTVVEPNALPDEPFDLGETSIVVVSTLLEQTDLQPYLIAASRGVPLVLRLVMAPAERAARIDELGRVAMLTTDDHPPTARLNQTQIALLALVADGSSVETAADAIDVGTRTAYRRLAEAMEVLGARSRVEAVGLARAAGLLPPPT